MRIHRNDEVVITHGKDRGKRGRVMNVDTKRDRIVVEGANMMKRHVRATAQARQAGIVEQPGAMHVSNALLWCPGCGKPTRVGYRIIQSAEAGQPGRRKVRICKKCDQEIE